MIVAIEGNKFDDFQIGTSKNEVEGLSQAGKFLEFNDIGKLITVSARLLNEFILNNTKLNTINLIDFLKTENPLVNNQFFIFPKYNLSLYPDLKNGIFLEVLLYDESLKNIYEKESFPHYNSLDNEFIKTFTTRDLELDPYIKIGNFKFGQSESSFLEENAISSIPSIGVGGKKIYHVDNFVFRFDQSEFTQLHIAYKSEVIIYKNVNIASQKTISDQLIKQNSIIESRSHYIFPELGVSIGKDLNNLDFFFFSRKLLPNWKNINRPITSW